MGLRMKTKAGITRIPPDVVAQGTEAVDSWCKKQPQPPVAKVKKTDRVKEEGDS